MAEVIARTSAARSRARRLCAGDLYHPRTDQVDLGLPPARNAVAGSALTSAIASCTLLARV
jgi:hypothetical protein